jgi:hypothetical protein
MFMTYQRFVTRVTQQVLHVEQELVILPEHLSTPLVFSGACVARSSVLCVQNVLFTRSLLVLFLLAIVIVCSSVYGF